MRNVVALPAVLSLALAACVGGNINGGSGGGDGAADGADGSDGNGDDGFADDGFDGSGDVGDDGSDGDDGQSSVCDETVPVQVTQTQKSPDVLLVLDKSGSMGEPLGFTGQSKMDV